MKNLQTSSLSDLGCRSEKSSDRGQILPDLQRQYPDIDQEAGEICESTGSGLTFDIHLLASNI
jgi:hypothetical protein